MSEISVTKKDIIWGYLAQFFLVASGLITLPLVLNILSAGKIPQKKIEEEAQKHGIVMKTLRNVKRELNIKSKKEGNQWVWILPE